MHTHDKPIKDYKAFIKDDYAVRLFEYEDKTVTMVYSKPPMLIEIHIPYAYYNGINDAKDAVEILFKAMNTLL